ncbi:hypothetical protein ACRARG_12440 [Pseudooceanicola sp. C21-150M6]|uniref:hypothetical protein n=1 Tax=Pseudooceanicola sp. C21-150M6 TaxID=3434355 RepID=UPI003D7FA871
MSHSDTGTVLHADEAAVVLDRAGHYQLYIPDQPDSREVSDRLLALTAVFIRLDQDPEFFQEQIEWMESHKG